MHVFQWLSTDFTQFYWTLPSFTRKVRRSHEYRPGFIEFYRVSRPVDEFDVVYLGVERVFGRIGLIAVDVEADGGARAARAAQTQHDPRSVLEHDPQSLEPHKKNPRSRWTVSLEPFPGHGSRVSIEIDRARSSFLCMKLTVILLRLWNEKTLPDRLKRIRSSSRQSSARNPIRCDARQPLTR